MDNRKENSSPNEPKENEYLNSLSKLVGKGAEIERMADYITATNNREHNHGIPSKEKRKQASFFLREIKITNPEDVDARLLLDIMVERCTKSEKYWCNRANMLRTANTFITIFVIMIQAVQVAIIHSPDYFGNGKLLASILPAFTSAVIATQQKLSWGKKSSQAKKSAQFFNKIQQHAEYRRNMIEAGGKLVDVVKLWNLSMLTDACEIPPPIFPY